jgi:catechol 2,3-dioxygenase-like lactoylglutathione lyase family enzyme
LPHSGSCGGATGDRLEWQVSHARSNVLVSSLEVCNVVATNRISAVLCSTDLTRSQEFYEQKVGLTLSPETIENHLVFECGDGTTLLVYGRGNPNQADHTQVRFWTSDVATDVHDLKERGVVFEEWDFPAFKTVDSIGTSPGIGKSAWFKDPDENTIALFQPE